MKNILLFVQIYCFFCFPQNISWNFVKRMFLLRLCPASDMAAASFSSSTRLFSFVCIISQWYFWKPCTCYIYIDYEIMIWLRDWLTLKWFSSIIYLAQYICVVWVPIDETQNTDLYLSPMIFWLKQLDASIALPHAPLIMNISGHLYEH